MLNAATSMFWTSVGIGNTPENMPAFIRIFGYLTEEEKIKT